MYERNLRASIGKTQMEVFTVFVVVDPAAGATSLSKLISNRGNARALGMDSLPGKRCQTLSERFRWIVLGHSGTRKSRQN